LCLALLEVSPARRLALHLSSLRVFRRPGYSIISSVPSPRASISQSPVYPPVLVRSPPFVVDHPHLVNSERQEKKTAQAKLPACTKGLKLLPARTNTNVQLKTRRRSP
jgi:hypothetical protein